MSKIFQQRPNNPRWWLLIVANGSSAVIRIRHRFIGCSRYPWILGQKWRAGKLVVGGGTTFPWKDSEIQRLKSLNWDSWFYNLDGGGGRYKVEDGVLANGLSVLSVSVSLTHSQSTIWVFVSFIWISYLIIYLMRWSDKTGIALRERWVRLNYQSCASHSANMSHRIVIKKLGPGSAQKVLEFFKREFIRVRWKLKYIHFFKYLPTNLLIFLLEWTAMWVPWTC